MVHVDGVFDDSGVGSAVGDLTGGDPSQDPEWRRSAVAGKPGGVESLPGGCLGSKVALPLSMAFRRRGPTVG